MAHYAFIDDNSIVTEVIVGRDEDNLAPGITSWEDYYGQLRGQTCKRTSYNTLGGQHLLGGIPFRGNYAGIGFRYDTGLDAFIPPQPFSSWTLDEATFQWESPVPEPDDGEPYSWDEDSLSWLPIAE